MLTRRQFLQTSVLSTGFLLIPKSVKKLYSQSITSCLPGCLPMGLCFAPRTPDSSDYPIEPNIQPTGVTLKSFEAKQPNILDYIRMIFTK